MEYVADELGVAVLKLPALQRELSPRADAAAILALREHHPRTPTRRPPHPHREGRARPAGSPPSLAGRARPRAVVHTYHGHVLSGYFSRRGSASSGSIERLLAHATGTLGRRERRGARRPRRASASRRQSRFAVVPYGFDLPAWSDGRRRGARADPGRAGARRGDVRRRLGGQADRDQAAARPRPHAAAAASTSASTPCSCSWATARTGRRSRRSRASSASPTAAGSSASSSGCGSGTPPFDATLLTSANEGTPVVAIESLAAERPVVATRAGGTATVVRDGESGFLRGGRRHRRAGAGGSPSSRAIPSCAPRLGRHGAADVRARFATARDGGRARRPSTGGCSAMKVVHVHKLTGVSGSESHLLALLPALRAAGHRRALPGPRRARKRRAAVLRAPRRAGRPVPAACAAARTSAPAWRVT